ncbi:hypothetical protein QCD79_21575, partial [Pseudomonas quasicaspiana]|nr:hypothetical protein [Pseudomonas quasicaspiana]
MAGVINADQIELKHRPGRSQLVGEADYLIEKIQCLANKLAPTGQRRAIHTKRRIGMQTSLNRKNKPTLS